MGKEGNGKNQDDTQNFGVNCHPASLKMLRLAMLISHMVGTDHNSRRIFETFLKECIKCLTHNSDNPI